MITEPSVECYKEMYMKPIAEKERQNDRITALESRIAELEAKLAGEKKDEGFKLWEPALGNIFYVINAQNDVIEKTRSLGDYQLLATYNCYETEKLAEQEAKWLRAARKLRAFARELNPEGWETSEGWVLARNHSGYYLPHFMNRLYGFTDVAQFHSREAAQVALDNLTEDERKVLFGS